MKKSTVGKIEQLKEEVSALTNKIEIIDEVNSEVSMHRIHDRLLIAYNVFVYE